MGLGRGGVRRGGREKKKKKKGEMLAGVEKVAGHHDGSAAFLFQTPFVAATCVLSPIPFMAPVT